MIKQLSRGSAILAICVRNCLTEKGFFYCSSNTGLENTIDRIIECPFSDREKATKRFVGKHPKFRCLITLRHKLSSNYQDRIALRQLQYYPSVMQFTSRGVLFINAHYVISFLKGTRSAWVIGGTSQYGGWYREFVMQHNKGVVGWGLFPPNEQWARS